MRVILISAAIASALAMLACAAAEASSEKALPNSDAKKTSPTIVVAASAPQGCADGFCLVATVGLYDPNDPTACPATSSISVTVGDELTYCYTVTNNTDVELDWHQISDTVNGVIFGFFYQPLPSGQTYSYLRTDRATTSVVDTATWVADDMLLTYTPSVSNIGSETVFCDGFDGAACPNGRFIDISATGTGVSLGDDDSSDITMPFVVTLYDQTSDQLGISNNGVATLGTPGFPIEGGNTSLPADTLPWVYMPLWDDFAAQQNQVFYDTRGEEPNRLFIVEWKNVLHNGATSNDGATFELQFREDNGQFSYVYEDVDYDGGPDGSGNGGSTATIGINAPSTQYVQYSFDKPTVSDGTVVDWAAREPISFTSSSDVNLDVGAPIIALTPDQFQQDVPQGGQVIATMQISNIGTRELEWTVGNLPADTHFPKEPAPATRSKTDLPSSALPVTQPTFAGAVSQGADKQTKASSLDEVTTARTLAFGYFTSPTTQGYGSLDPSSPTRITILSDPQIFFSAGTFVNNDFTVEYVIDFETGDLYSEDTATGNATLIGSTGLGERVSGMKWDAVSGSVYLVTADCVTPGSSLYTIDVLTGVVTFVGTAGGSCIAGMSVDQNGLMYAIDIAQDTLLAVDKETATYETIGSIGFDANYITQGLDFDPRSGILYYAATDNNAKGYIYTVDTLTGYARFVARTGGSQRAAIGAFAIAENSTECANPTEQPWISVSPGSGTINPGESVTVSLSFSAEGYTAGDVVSSELCVRSNDAVTADRLSIVPLQMTVDPSRTKP